MEDIGLTTSKNRKRLRGLFDAKAEDGVEFDGVGGDAALAMEEVEKGDAGDVDEDLAGRRLKGSGGHAEAGFDFAASGFKIGGMERRASAGTFG